ncbi:MAG TPA: AarF/UbiB family protein [Pyrinomonadaceae bacterium]|jgi:ubiquinone biosynthesis protein
MIKQALLPTPLRPASARAKVKIAPHAGRRGGGVVWVVWRLLRWRLALPWLRLTRRGDAEAESARRLRRLLEQMGGLWIKAGQLMSLRSDVLSPAMIRELSKLQFRAEGFPFHIARALMEEELGSPLGEIFDAFEEEPIAAASISQVYRARLRRERRWVAVKVQRPDVRLNFGRDMTILRGLLGLLARVPSLAYLGWDEVLWELEQIMLEEVDYRYEAANMRRMKRVLRRHKVYVPAVYDYSTRRVLVMEYVAGVLMSEFIEASLNDRARLLEWLEENKVDPRKVGERLFISFFRQLFEDNQFHGDLHPGNIMLLRGGRIAFIDFGTVGTSDTHFLTYYQMGMQALGEQDYSRAVDYIFLLCDQLPRTNLEEAKAVLVGTYEAWSKRARLRELPYYEKSIGNVGSEAGRVLFPYRVVMSWQFMKISRTWATLDASLSYLIPGVNYVLLVRKYFRGAQRRSHGRLRRFGLSGVADAVSTRVEEFSFFRSEITQRASYTFGGLRGKLDDFILLFVSCLTAATLASFFVAAAVYLRQSLGLFAGFGALARLAEKLPRLPDSAWLLALLFLLYLYLVFARLKRRVSVREAAD